MATANTRKLFVNLAVRNPEKATDFFAALGFAYNRRFTDDKASCMVLGDEASYMGEPT